MKTTEIKRGAYNEINLISLNEKTKKQVINLFSEAKEADKVDEHGTWEFGCEFDKKGRGYAINWDLYALGRDMHNKRLMIVIQIRKYEKRRKNGFGNVRKSYFLIGRNEDNTTFAHSIESRVIHAAINSGKDVIKACQDWIFGTDYAKVIRQGDLALIPIKRITAKEIEQKEMLIEKSHLLIADKIMRNGYIYAENPVLVHQPGTHPRVEASGLYRLTVGKRAAHWDFAAPTID